MKIAVVGCGAVGSFYGARLCRSGQETHFLLRSDYDAVRQNGVVIKSPAGDFQVRPHCARSPEEIGICDVVLIGLKTTANREYSRLLPALAGKDTAFLTLQNGLGNEEQLARLFLPSQILGGLCFVCLNRIAPGVVRHLDHGLVVLGEFRGGPKPRTEAIAASFRNAGVECRVAPNLARAHWEKLVWNIPFNGLGVAAAAGYEALNLNRPATSFANPPGACMATDGLLGDRRWESLVRALMLEVIHTAHALGFDIPEDLADKQIERTRTMGSYKASTLLDFEAGRTLEIEGLFLEPLRQAHAAGTPVPMLEALCGVLEKLERARARNEAGGLPPARASGRLV